MCNKSNWKCELEAKLNVVLGEDAMMMIMMEIIFSFFVVQLFMLQTSDLQIHHKRKGREKKKDYVLQ